ncbi:MAG: hypothetical protein JRJ87_24640 [Deltaproteobacteria bacterium]|nr:hypothetical protein [Deltaproteobacteria bacterium]
MNDLRPAGPAAYDGALSTPIKVKRRRRIRHPMLWLLGIILLLSGLLVLRVGLVSFPAFEQKSVNSDDGWHILRGAYHLVAPTGQVSDQESLVQSAFKAEIDFLVLAGSDLESANKIAASAPFPVVVGQEIVTGQGTVVAINPTGGVAIKKKGIMSVFSEVKQAGGWTVVANPLDVDNPWTAWDTHGYEGIEFFNVARQLQSITFTDRLGHWIGLVLGSQYSQVYLGRRAVGGLGHWDDGNRQTQVIGFCALGVEGDFDLLRAVTTYLLVPEGFGPYGPAEVEKALKQGHHFCALPFFGDPAGFRFEARAEPGTTPLGIMGDRIDFQAGIELIADLNLPHDPGILVFHLFLDGREVLTTNGTRINYKVSVPGTYRVEIGVKFADIPWGESERLFLYSNPIHILK